MKQPILLISLCALLVTQAFADTETLPPLKGAAPQTAEAMWAGFDPQAEPLETEVLHEWEEDGVVMKVVRYRVGMFKGQRAMMAGIYGHLKEAKQLPALLNIHGGGQYADYKSVLTNAKRGYATLSIAWAGRISSPHYRVSPNEVTLFWEGKTNDPNYRVTTDWGALDGYHAPCRNPKNAFAHTSPHPWTIDAIDSPRNNPWFVVTMGARRGLTFLELQPEVDGHRLGVYGHSMGGKLTVLTTAADKRVKVAAPSCGGVTNFDSDNALYNATIGDRANLTRIHCPTIFLKPSNDFHGRINHLPKAIELLGQQPWRVTCSPHHNHQDTAEYQVAGLLWMDQFLKKHFQFPETPKTTLTLNTDSGIPQFEVVTDPGKEIVSIDVFYTQQGSADETMDNSKNRYWHHAVAEPQDASRTRAALPVFATDQPLWVYANVLYKLDQPTTGAGYYYGVYTADTVNLSSLVEIVSPAQLQAAGVKATLQPTMLIEDFEGDWQKGWFNYRPEQWDLRTHKVYHPMWHAPENARLSFKVGVREANKLVVGIDGYAAEVALAGGPMWQSVALAASEFKDANDEAMVSFEGIKELRFVASEHLNGKKDGERIRKRVGGSWQGAPPNFRELRWVTD